MHLATLPPVHSVIRREGPQVVILGGGALGMHVATSHSTQFRYNIFKLLTLLDKDVNKLDK